MTQDIPIIKQGICPIIDGTCPTSLNDLHDGDDGFCGFYGHIIKAKYTICECNHTREKHPTTDPDGSSHNCLECECKTFKLKEKELKE